MVIIVVTTYGLTVMTNPHMAITKWPSVGGHRLRRATRVLGIAGMGPRSAAGWSDPAVGSGRQLVDVLGTPELSKCALRGRFPGTPTPGSSQYVGEADRDDRTAERTGQVRPL